jgi:hypothetical protein
MVGVTHHAFMWSICSAGHTLFRLLHFYYSLFEISVPYTCGGLFAALTMGNENFSGRSTRNSSISWMRRQRVLGLCAFLHVGPFALLTHEHVSALPSCALCRLAIIVSNNPRRLEFLRRLLRQADAVLLRVRPSWFSISLPGSWLLHLRGSLAPPSILQPGFSVFSEFFSCQSVAVRFGSVGC